MRRILFSFLILLGLALPVQADRLLVFAAASLAGPLDEAARLWNAENATDVVISYAGSSALARQIEAGAPADVFLSANEGWMDDLAAKEFVDNDTRRVLWRNRLVLVSHAAGPEMQLDPEMDLPGLLDGQRLAVALTDAVPAGVYAREALASFGAWDAVKDQLAEADNVRAALALVAVGAAPWGIVYATDAQAEPRVHLRGVFPDDAHMPVTYPAAAMSGSLAEAAAFLDHLSSGPVRALFRAAGFQVVPAP
ncbi:putative molybdate-binding periplasmic abc transporter protein [Pseudooceanicola batsensis HTCC2597]|uniref:Putative molybdate-binding periplasmic abc transporter protein n=1 Tax=Pseudooceanicola batsensis (strain ATCC BAA-863 / DSM 15984 / KCTC 12145 / HTCC2597) TaxID=252305 RepID=A3TTE6_PSEBH|nr:molybdate ABC transporter substrate-binding protein [Pseudooceanicola batsensis]EAQ04923.1 putative molybdate-binding periplasmic abc transporter protein [Pseudooceanicola batsensis HTCC2597]